jgi:penicillin-binding protein 1C
MHDAAAMVVDNKTGQVLAYVGSVGPLSSAGAVDGIMARRQAGSTLKPFIYSLALEEGFLTASSKIEDALTHISLGPGMVYCPRNFDHQYHGADVTVRTALASSLNIPAVKTIQMVGVGALVNRLKGLGFIKMRSEEFYGPSLALGTADVTLWELVNAYRTLANAGQWSEMRLLPKREQKVQVKRMFSPQVAFIVGDILSDRSSRSLTFGLDSPMALRFWSAVKTGTSQDMRDNWCIGYSNEYTVGVWTGNFSGKPMWNVTGVSGAAPAWAEIMAMLPHSKNGLAPKPPKGLVAHQGQCYVQGTEPSALLLKADEKPFQPCKITYPAKGLMIARDPDIPVHLERVFFEASWYDPSHKWVLNGKLLASAGSKFAWQPQARGTYQLDLVSLTGKVLDHVDFFVR